MEEEEKVEEYHQVKIKRMRKTLAKKESMTKKKKKVNIRKLGKYKKDIKKEKPDSMGKERKATEEHVEKGR